MSSQPRVGGLSETRCLRLEQTGLPESGLDIFEHPGREPQAAIGIEIEASVLTHPDAVPDIREIEQSRLIWVQRHPGIRSLRILDDEPNGLFTVAG